MSIREKAEELRVYADLEGTEVGELCQALIAAAYNAEYASEDFGQALYKEIVFQLKNFQNNYKIVEHEEKFTRKSTYLEWAP